MRENFEKLKIEKDKFEIYQLDAKEPKIFGSELADMAVVKHLLCFANSKEEMKNMCMTIFINIKSVC